MTPALLHMLRRNLARQSDLHHLSGNYRCAGRCHHELLL